MATEHAMATMEKEANDKITSALSALSTELKIEIPPEQWERSDARMRQVRGLQRQAMILELICGGLGIKGTQSPEPNDDAVTASDTNEKPATAKPTTGTRKP